MDINEYAAGGQLLYEAFAETVATILQQAITAAGLKASRPQSQHRAKHADRLRARLLEKSLVSAPNIEELRKDLAGCRLIFYTNGDLNEFLQSRILSENFEIDYDSTRIHHPVAKDGSDRQYRGYNFVVRLKESRASLPEYVRFAGLRCEVQLQTILNHAWSETSHDIVYKQPLGTEFAKKALTQIDKRFSDIMLKYLVPAGHEFDKAKHDFESLMQGKPIFEKGPLRALKEAADNNERRDILERIREHFLPNHDDVTPLIPELLATVEEAINRSRGTPAAIIRSNTMELEGWTGDDVIDAALDLLDFLRYANPEATFDLLVRQMKVTASRKEKDRILESAQRLAAVPIGVVRRAGGEVQLRVVRRLEELEPTDRAVVRPLALKICEEVLKPDVTGTSGSYRTVTFERGAMPATKEIEVARTKAISLLEALYPETTSDTDRIVVLQHLSQASRTPTQGQYTNALVAMILADSLKVMAFLSEILGEASFEVKKVIEHDAWDVYRILCRAHFDGDNDGTLSRLQEQLRPAALKIRDALAFDNEYEIFKTLVSLNSVYFPAWDTLDFDYKRNDAWRSQRIESYLTEVTAATAELWWARLERCAASESIDLAAHRGLRELLSRLCEEKPELVIQRLDSLSESLACFLPLILSSLAKSTRKADLQPILERWAKEGKHLGSLAQHYRITKNVNVAVLSEVFQMAVKNADHRVVVEIIATLVDTFGQPDKAGKALLLQAIAWCAKEIRTDWLDEIWFMEKGVRALAEDLTDVERETVLKALVPHNRADVHLGYLLSPFAIIDLQGVISFFGARLKYATSAQPKTRYEAVPHALTELKPLRENIMVVFDAVLEWMKDDSDSGNNEAGSFVSAVSPEITDELAAAMVARATKDKKVARSVLNMLSNFDGSEPVFAVCREIVGSLESGDEELLRKVAFVLEQTGTVSGEFGFVEVYISKKKLLEGWLGDARESVVGFAKKEISSLERMIASEQDRSEQRYALEKLNWGEPVDDDSQDL